MSTVHILVSVDGYGVGGTVALDTNHSQSDWDELTEEQQGEVAHQVYAENVSWGWHVATPEEIEEWG